MMEQALVIFLLVPLQSVAAAEHITRSLLSGVLTDCWVLFRVEAFAVLHEAQLFRDVLVCDGDVTAESILGEGTTIRLMLPTARESQVPQAPV